ncbi:hypothetical protein F5876DRAFT_75589 [Lentinula aff. lateritia]|uniref:Uncharacterized protein n=1 Tax=Lentinula aff. lateritia TaxID=2804960 RepID=A0ACC1U4B5_9AGAR|nr:hypothetical protein F5876DRAFT_75589 [Lentinula aff. lateritia]
MSIPIPAIAEHANGPASVLRLSRTLQASTEAFIRWRDAEVALALKDMEATREYERLLRIDLQNQLILSEQNLRACERHLELVQKKVTPDLRKTNMDSARLQQEETDLKSIIDALKRIGIRLCKDTKEVLCLVCDVDTDARWTQVQQPNSPEDNHRSSQDLLNIPLCSPTSQRAMIQKQPLNAIAAIDTLLDAHDKDMAEKRILSARCNTAESVADQLKKEMEVKDSRIAELEAKIASMWVEEPCSTTGVTNVTCISPSQLFENPNFSPFLSESSSSSNPFQPVGVAFNNPESDSSYTDPSDDSALLNASVSQIRKPKSLPPSNSDKAGCGGTRIWYHQYANP